MVDANACTGKREHGCSDASVMGAYRRDKLNENGERLLGFAADNQLCLVNTYFGVPKGEAHVPGLQQVEGKMPPRLHPMRQVDQRDARNAAVQRVDFKDSDHNLVHATVQLPGRIAPNRRKRDGTQVRIDLLL